RHRATAVGGRRGGRRCRTRARAPGRFRGGGLSDPADPPNGRRRRARAISGARARSRRQGGGCRAYAPTCRLRRHMCSRPSPPVYAIQRPFAQITAPALIAGSAPSHGQGPMPAYYRPPNEKHEIREDAMSRTLSTALLVAAVAAVSALAPSARAQEAVPLHGAVQFNDDHAFNKALLRFEQLVKQYYGKPINFVLHRNSELGLEKDYFAYMNQGISVDYGIVSPAHMSTFSKAAPFIDAPFLFRDLD